VIAKIPRKENVTAKADGPGQGAICLASLARSHLVVMMMMMMMVVVVMHRPGLCARDRRNRERHGGKGGQHESKFLHRDSFLGWIH